MNRKHIGLIYTGGTIGMTATEHGYAPMPDFSAVLSLLLERSSDALPIYTLYTYDQPIDSTNATPADWQRIARDIAARYADHDGFVVLHGTDTMAYTASALSFMLQGLRKPVVVTGSQIPMRVPGSDAMQNLMTSMMIAASDTVREVVICFNQTLLRGNRAIKVSAESFNAFDSPNYPQLADIGIHVRYNEAALLQSADKENFQLPDYASGEVLSLRFLPGLPLQAVEAMFALRPKAVILECFGAGNAPDRDPGLLQLLSRESARGTIIVASSQSQHGTVSIGTYAAGAGMAAAGVIGTGDMSFEAAFAKLHHLLALGLSPEEVKRDFVRDLAGERSC